MCAWWCITLCQSLLKILTPQTHNHTEPGLVVSLTERLLIGNQRQRSGEGPAGRTTPVVSRFRPWQRKRHWSLFHNLTSSPVWNGSSCFFLTVAHNGTKRLRLVQVQLAAKRPGCRENGEKARNRHGGGENSVAVLSVVLRELPSELI